MAQDVVGGRSGSRKVMAALVALGTAWVSIAQAVTISKTCSPINKKGDFARHVVLDGDRYRADNICYADGKRWQETNQNTGKLLTLYQRFDYYRPNVPFDTPLPVVIWAHPTGESEDISNSTRDGELVQPALAAGFAFISIEFRHPISSQPDGGGQDIPNTDVASAVQWARQWANDLGIKPKNVFILAQSRGTLGLLTALMPDQKDKNSLKPYLHQSSRVNAMFGYQAQSSYIEDEVATTFITPDTQALFRADYPDVPMNPGSAIDEASTDDPPVMLRYDETPQDPDHVTQTPYCPDTAVIPFGMQCFGVHNPNFGVALRQAFIGKGAGNLISVEYGYNGDAQAAFRGYIDFFAANLK